MNRFLSLVATAGVSTLFAATSSATIVVDYDNDTFGSGDGLNDPGNFVISDLDGDTLDDDVTGWMNNKTDITTAFSPGGSYLGPDIYGAVRLQALDQNTVGADNDDLVPINLRVQGTTERMHMLIYFRNDSGDWAFDSDSYLALANDGTESGNSISRWDALSGARWVVQDTSGNFYVSDTGISNNADGGTLTGDEMFGLNSETATMWAAYDFASEINADLASLSYTIGTGDLPALHGFGFYAEADAFASNRIWVDVKDFTANAIPEPASMALLGLGSLVMLRRRQA